MSNLDINISIGEKVYHVIAYGDLYFAVEVGKVQRVQIQDGKVYLELLLDSGGVIWVYFKYCAKSLDGVRGKLLADFTSEFEQLVSNNATISLKQFILRKLPILEDRFRHLDFLEKSGF